MLLNFTGIIFRQFEKPDCERPLTRDTKLIMKINKYYPFVFIYFFVNIIGLPFGMLYTTLLTPLFYFWLVTKGKKQLIVKFLIFFLPFIICHFINGVNIFYYIKTLVLYFTVYIFCYAFYTLLTVYKGMEQAFKKVLITNFILTLVALLFLVTPYASLFWGKWSIYTPGLNIENWPRLKMFTYEPSYYATLFVPVFCFFLVKFFLKQIKKDVLMIIIMITLPLVLSLSLGVIACLIISISILFFYNIRSIISNKKKLYSIFGLGITILLILVILIIFYRENPIFVRIAAVLDGKDGSANGRTFQAFHLAYIIADLKSLWWGIGPGQLKVVGDSIIRAFYKYPPTYGQVSIPSAFAETFTLFGIIGTCLRLTVEIYLFFKTKVLSNYYRTMLFFYIFIYQFTGSFTTNIAEYVIWILAFTNAFPQYDKQTPLTTSNSR